jgi:hypothetical protein
MLQTMIFLAVNATILHELASGAHLEFDVVPSRFAT